jgi:DNA-binding transcriptional MocR family regulator
MGATASRRFVEVADRLATMISQGGLRAGQRLPSVRELSASLGIGAATALAACAELERRGLVQGRPRSGFYLTPRPRETSFERASLSRLLAAPQSPDETTRLLMAAGHEPEVIALDTAAPHVSLTPLREFRTIFARALRKHPIVAADYIFPPGRETLRRAVARRLVRAGCVLVPDDIVITTGATEALLLAVRAVTKPGDTIAIESPTYYGILQVMRSLGLRALEIPTDPETGMRVDALAHALARRRVAACFLMPNFSNPLGSQMPADNVQAIVELLGKAGIPLIEDDANGELAFSASRPHAAKSYDRRGLVMLCGSVSKTLAPGCRVGWTVPGKARDRVMELQWTSTVSAASPSQLAVAEYFTSSACDRHLRSLRQIVSRNVERFTRAVARYFPPGTTTTRPVGGLVLWVGLPCGVSALHLHRAALTERIAIMPGTIFSPGARYDSHVRICCAVPWSDAIEDAVMRLGRLCAKAANGD